MQSLERAFREDRAWVVCAYPVEWLVNLTSTVNNIFVIAAKCGYHRVLAARLALLMCSAAASLLLLFFFSTAAERGTPGTVEAFSIRGNAPITALSGFNRTLKSPIHVYSSNKMDLSVEGQGGVEGEAMSRQSQARPFVHITPMLDVTYFKFR